MVKKVIEQKKYPNRYEDAEYGLNLWNTYMKSFGLGEKLKSDVFGLRPGLIPNSSYYDKWYGHHRWAFSTIRSISIGQGEVKLTPLHMANIAAIIGNKISSLSLILTIFIFRTLLNVKSALTR